MLYTGKNEWGLVIPSTADGTRPNNAGFGSSITPGNNAYGSYVSLIAGASLTDDVYLIDICVNNVGIASTARDCVVSLGLDPAGGTSFTGVVDLVCGPAALYGSGSLLGGTWYRFPYFIKAGTSIGMAGAVNSATLTAFSAYVVCYCRPSRPDAVTVGTYIDQYGVALASSAGTAITPGTTSDGAFTALGTAMRPGWWMEFGYGVNNSAMSAAMIHADVAIGSGASLKSAISNAMVSTTSGDQLAKHRGADGVAIVATGDVIYGRSQAGAGTVGHSMAAYVVGG